MTATGGASGDRGLHFSVFSARYVYSTVFEIVPPAPLHVLLWWLCHGGKEGATGSKFTAAGWEFLKSWGVGNPDDGKWIQPTLAMHEDEDWPTDESHDKTSHRMKDDDRDVIHRSIWLEVDVGALFTDRNGAEVLTLRKNGDPQLLLQNGSDPENEQKKCSATASCQIRFFECGAAICIFRFDLKDLAGDTVIERWLRIPRWEPGAFNECNHTLQALYGESKNLWQLQSTALERFFVSLQLAVKSTETADFITTRELERLGKAGANGGDELEDLRARLSQLLTDSVDNKMDAQKQRSKVEAERLRPILKEDKFTLVPTIPRLEDRFPIVVAWRDRELMKVSGPNGTKRDPQIPFFVGIGRLKRPSPPESPGKSRFPFMLPPVDPAFARAHRQVLELALRVFGHRAFASDDGGWRLYPQERDVHWSGSLPKDHPLRNRVWNDWMWVTFTKRSALLFAYDDDLKEALKEAEAKAEKNPVVQLFQVWDHALTDIAGVIRSRWHLLVVLNRLLDREVLRLRESHLTNPRFLEQLVRLRRFFALYLDDPLANRFEGGSFEGLGQDARTFFMLDRLEDMLRTKFSQVARMHDEHLHRLAMDQLQAGLD